MSRSASFQKNTSHLRVFCLPGFSCQFEECDLDLFMTIHLPPICKLKIMADQIRSFLDPVEEAVAQPKIMVGNAGFDQVSHAVELMLDLQVFPAAIREKDLIIGVDISILSLRCQDQISQMIHPLLQVEARIMTKDAACGIQPFISVRI